MVLEYLVGQQYELDGLDRDFDKMITSEPCDYRRKYVRLYQVLGMLGLPSSCFFWV